MLRISKLTDYATLLMTRFAREPGNCLSAAQLSEASGVPLPTVAKLLKRLSQAELLVSVRGAGGGYLLAHAPRAISVADVVSAIEGPVALTECVQGQGACAIEAGCATRANWHVISRAVRTALEGVSLADMAVPRLRALPLQRMAMKEK